MNTALLYGWLAFNIFLWCLNIHDFHVHEITTYDRAYGDL